MDTDFGVSYQTLSSSKGENSAGSVQLSLEEDVSYAVSAVLADTLSRFKRSALDRNADARCVGIPKSRFLREYSHRLTLQYKMARRSQQRFEVEHSCIRGDRSSKTACRGANTTCRSWMRHLFGAKPTTNTRSVRMAGTRQRLSPR